ncbi:hypothetical protein AGMMS50276_32540 [Synergistales bacterium]|nr:hypothetical protein AGMMS50276_32540 [Synergistales bacterium]
MSSPFFTIVIPTRNGHKFLPYALATCLKQVDFDDFEVIVSDNSDVGNNLSYEAIKEHIGDRVRYIRPPEALNQQKHWQWILDSGNINGEYVMYMGDDDGLTRDALREYYECIKATGAEAVMSNPLRYQWSGFEYPPTYVARNNVGAFCRIVPNNGEQYHIMNSEEVFQKALDFDPAGLARLPCVYWGMVKRELIVSIGKKYGEYFDVTVDYYSAFLTAYNLKKYALVDKALCIMGYSIKSVTYSVNLKEPNTVKPKITTYMCGVTWSSAAGIRISIEILAEKILMSKKLPIFGYCKALWIECLTSVRGGSIGKRVRGLLLHAFKYHYLMPLFLAFVFLAIKKTKNTLIGKARRETIIQYKHYSGEEWGFSDVDSFAQVAYDFCFSEDIPNS